MAAVFDTPQTEAIGRLRAAVDDLLSVGLTPSDEADARLLMTDLEVEGRRIRAAQVEIMDEIDTTGLYAADGHASAKVMARTRSAERPSPHGARGWASAEVLEPRDQALTEALEREPLPTMGRWRAMFWTEAWAA